MRSGTKIVQAMGGLKGGGLKRLRGSPISGRYSCVSALKTEYIVKTLKAITPAVQTPQSTIESQLSDGTAGS